MLYTPSHVALGRHPKTKKLARLLGVGIPTALGHLHLLWHFALQYAPDGDLSRFDFEEIAEGCMWDGPVEVFENAFGESGWIEVGADRLALHDWQDYGGKAIRQKESNADRQQRWRDRHKVVTPPSPNGRVTVTSPLYNALEEKRREESISPPLTPPAGGDADAPPSVVQLHPAPKPTTLSEQQQTRFERWYAAYPRHEHRPEAEKAWRKHDPDDAMTDRLIADVQRRKGGRKWGEGFVELPATYLNQRAWEDDIEPLRLRHPSQADHNSAKHGRPVI